MIALVAPSPIDVEEGFALMPDLPLEGAMPVEQIEEVECLPPFLVDEVEYDDDFYTEDQEGPVALVDEDYAVTDPATSISLCPERRHAPSLPTVTMHPKDSHQFFTNGLSAPSLSSQRCLNLGLMRRSPCPPEPADEEFRAADENDPKEPPGPRSEIEPCQLEGVLGQRPDHPVVCRQEEDAEANQSLVTKLASGWANLANMFTHRGQ